MLVLYWNPYGKRVRTAVASHLDAVCGAAGRQSVVAYNAHGGAPPFLRRLDPTAVVLHTTFLATRWIAPFLQWQARSSWISELACVKLALPQDDYDHARVLDDWLAELGVDHVFTALPDAADVLYPLTRRRAQIHGVLTGYVEPAAARAAVAAAPLAERPFDVVYRATSLPFWFGRLGLLKAEVGRAAAVAAASRGLRADISTDPAAAVTGAAWFDFLASGRVVVGCESGASVVDPDGSVRRAVEAVLAERPDASYDEVTSLVPAAWDEQWFGVVSPRHFEAAATRTAQILVRGAYSGVLEAGRHYVPVAEDLSDLGDALERTAEPSIAAEVAECAYEELVASGRYSYERLTAELRSALPEAGPGGGRPGSFQTARVAAAGASALASGRAALRRLAGRDRAYS